MSTHGDSDSASAGEEQPAVAGPSQKRKRKRPCPAMSHQEMQTMVDGLVHHADVLFGSKERKTPTSTKNALWNTIAEQVSAVGVAPRSAVELKKRWQDLKVRTRKKVMEDRKARMGTGGGTAPDLVLFPWEEACFNLMDPTALEGVGVADYGAVEAHADVGSQGVSTQVTQTPVPARTSTPLTPVPAGTSTPLTPVPSRTSTPAPRRVRTLIPPQAQPPAAVVTGESTDAVGFQGPTAVPAEQHGLDTDSAANAAIADSEDPHDADSESEEETVTLQLTNVHQIPPPDAALDHMEEEEVVASPHCYDIPEDTDDNLLEAPNMGVLETQILQSILARLSALEAAGARPSQNDTQIRDALVQLAKSTVTQTAAIMGVQRLLEQSTKRTEAALGLLSTAVIGQTEELRLLGGKIVTAVSELTVAMRQTLASAAAQQAVARPSTSSSPSRSSDAPSTSISPPPQRGVRRQRTGRRGRQ